MKTQMQSTVILAFTQIASMFKKLIEASNIIVILMMRKIVWQSDAVTDISAKENIMVVALLRLNYQA